MKHIIFCWIIAVSISSYAAASIDTNANQMSDLWEREFNLGNLYPPSFLPSGDADGDGQPNLAESISGTDPNSSHGVEGFFSCELTHILPVWTTDPLTQALVLESPEAYRIEWHGAHGKNYTLMASDDLIHWQPLGNSVKGYNHPIAGICFPLDGEGQPVERLYWKVTVQDVDTDQDGLNDWEEYILGTNPNSGETLPGISDNWLARHFMDQLLDYGLASIDLTADPDGDGSDHAEEYMNGSDPNIANNPDSQSWLKLVGTGPENDPIPKTRQFQLQPGQSALVVLAIGSTEFPEYTDPSTTNEYNDILTWSITSSGNTTISGEVDVNTLHDEWSTASALDEPFPGIGAAVHYQDIQVIEAPPNSPLTINVTLTATNIGDDARPSVISVGVIPLDMAPEILTVNSDFDEGRIDPATGFAIPDCDDEHIALEAQRNHLDGRFAINERITEDLHPGFFGVDPTRIWSSFWTNTNITISKVDQTDPSTGHREAGQVRLYGKWGEDASQYRAIVPYDFGSLAATNLTSGGINRAPGETTYGPLSPFYTGTSFYLEGVHPGRITLEWRLQKGDFDVVFDQDFQIYTRKTATQWRVDLNYKIRLETSNDPSGQIQTVDFPVIEDGYRKNIERASEFYDFYSECFTQPLRSYSGGYPHALSWPGLARLAGSQVIGGLSDSEYARWIVEYGPEFSPILASMDPFGFSEWTAEEIEELQIILFEGGWRIFASAGWQLHAFRSSGTEAIRHVSEATQDLDASILLPAWLELRQGTLDHDIILINSAARSITDREQNNTIVPTWNVINGLFGGYASDIFTILGKNSYTPAGLDFTDIFPYPTGSLANTADRWTWIDSSTTGGILDTWNSESIVRKLTLNRIPLNIDAERFSEISSFTTSIPILCWDDEDIP